MMKGEVHQKMYARGPENAGPQNGFTLLEVMVALSVLAIGILAIISMHITAVKGNTSAVDFTDAMLSAQCQIESMIRDDFDNIDNSGAVTTDGYTVVTGAGSPCVFAGNTIEWQVLQTMDISNPVDGIDDLMRINVRVRDSDGKKLSDLVFLKDRE